MPSRKVTRRNKVRARIRKNISGSSELPRLSVFRSNKQIYVQLIDDLTGKTLALLDRLESRKRKVLRKLIKPRWSELRSRSEL